jgi:N-methylhydantoinase B
VHAPEGTICNAAFPASTSCSTGCPADMMQDAVNRAMAAAVGERVPAGSCRRCNVFFGGVDETSGEPWGVMFVNNGGGGGAALGTDGWPLMSTLAAWGGLTSLPVEQIELLYPVLVEHMEIEPDSMGLGEWIGGPGVRLVVRPLRGSAEVVTVGDGARNPPHGALGGTPGIGGGQYIESLDGGHRRFVSATGEFGVLMGQRWVGVTSGGGGYGNPLRRDAERVRQDVRDGVITRDAAQRVFGVSVGEGLDPLIDLDATRDLRAQLDSLPLPVISGAERRSGTWLEDNRRDGDDYVSNPHEI